MDNKNINPHRIYSVLHTKFGSTGNQTCVSVAEQKKGKKCIKRGEPGCKPNGCCCAESSIAGQPQCQSGGAGAGSFCD